MLLDWRRHRHGRPGAETTSRWRHKGVNRGPCLGFATLLAQGWDAVEAIAAPLSGHVEPARAPGELAVRHDTPVLMSGAGGYQPLMHTPAVWAAFASKLSVADAGVAGCSGGSDEQLVHRPLEVGDELAPG